MPETGPTEYGTLASSDNDGSATCGLSEQEGDVWYDYRAFVPGKLWGWAEGMVVCLVDDVWTTGTTMGQAARTIRRVRFMSSRKCWPNDFRAFSPWRLMISRSGG